jgi:hypothetical protein
MKYDYPVDDGTFKVDTDNFDENSNLIQMLVKHIGRSCSGPTGDIARLLKEGPPEPGMIIGAISQHRAGWTKPKAVGL